MHMFLAFIFRRWIHLGYDEDGTMSYDMTHYFIRMQFLLTCPDLKPPAGSSFQGSSTSNLVFLKSLIVCTYTVLWGMSNPNWIRSSCQSTFQLVGMMAQWLEEGTMTGETPHHVMAVNWLLLEGCQIELSSWKPPSNPRQIWRCWIWPMFQP